MKHRTDAPSSSPSAHARPFGRIARYALAGALALGCMPPVAFAAPADEGGVMERIVADQSSRWERVLEAGTVSALYDHNATSSSDEATAGLLASDSAYLPSSFDLRDLGVVTPVKQQNPWSTCWGFAAAAAAETSVLSELGVAYGEVPLDLSELHLAWFSQTPLPVDGFSQGGEGSYATDPNPNKRLDTGGFNYTATSIFSSGIGPLLEEEVPYRNAEGYTVKAPDGTPQFYSPEGDWSVDEDLRFAQVFELEESSLLPCPAGRDEEGQYFYRSEGTTAIKRELAEGRAVQICFRADQSLPGQPSEDRYINPDTWAHYTSAPDFANHAVTIVGWDDDYSASNFTEGQQPPADGAWIVKNSWGSASGAFPNSMPNGWGVDGEGCFYLSYYDQSLMSPETLDFDLSRMDSEDEFYYVGAYDYMPSQGVNSYDSQELAKMSNVFTAAGDQVLRTLSAETSSPYTTVDYDVYLLDEGATDPEQGTLVAHETATYEYGGYHRVDLTTPVTLLAGETFSVVVTQRDASGVYKVLVEAGANEAAYEESVAQGFEMRAYVKGVVNEGESFLYEDGAWTDMVELIEETQATENGRFIDYDNFAIKVYADPADSMDFEDVPEDAWYTGVVDYVSARGIMSGYGNGKFGPLETMNAQDIACLLFKYLAPEEAAKYATPESYASVEDTSGLSDVEDGKYYTPAVNWAFENKLLYGHDDGTLGVNQPLDRERFAVILHRVAGSPESSASIDSFGDAQSVSSWAADSIAWCVENGIIEGAEGNILPQNDALRAEVAKMMMVYDRMLLEPEE